MLIIRLELEYVLLFVLASMIIWEFQLDYMIVLEIITRKDVLEHVKCLELGLIGKLTYVCTDAQVMIIQKYQLILKTSERDVQSRYRVLNILISTMVKM